MGFDSFRKQALFERAHTFDGGGELLEKKFLKVFMKHILSVFFS
jgi:hypothetical protein